MPPNQRYHSINSHCSISLRALIETGSHICVKELEVVGSILEANPEAGEAIDVRLPGSYALPWAAGNDLSGKRKFHRFVYQADLETGETYIFDFVHYKDWDEYLGKSKSVWRKLLKSIVGIARILLLQRAD